MIQFYLFLDSKYLRKAYHKKIMKLYEFEYIIKNFKKKNI